MRFNVLASTALLVAGGAFLGNAAMAADAVGAATNAAAFQPIPAVSISARTDTAQTGTSTTGTPRYYYYPSYNYQPGSNTVGQTPTLYYLPGTNTTQPRVVTPTVTPTPATTAPVIRRVVTTPARPRFEDLSIGYLSLKGAYLMPDEFKYNDDGTGSAATPVANDVEGPYTADLKDGFAITGAIGTNLLSSSLGRTRIELEGGYRQADAGELTGTVYNNTAAAVATKVDSSSGDMTILSGMANVYQDFRLGPLSPYVGVGAGLAQVKFDGLHADECGAAPATATFGTGANPATNNCTLNDTSTNFAYQGMLGLELEVASNLGLMIEGRHFAVHKADIQAADGTETEDTISSNELGLGLKFSF